VEQEKMAVAKQWLCKNTLAATNTHATAELLDHVFYAVRVISNTQNIVKGK
jgi:hypothetical protein